ncbi:hypothetical protein ACF0H5_003640 [Mactra antiquata]
MADRTPTRTAYVSVICVLTLGALFTAISIVQFKWTRDLQQQYEITLQELYQLKSSCIGINSDDVKPEEGQADNNERQKRQLTGSLQQMLVDMMVAQENILIQHCTNNSKLCLPGPKGEKGFSGGPGLPGLPGTQGVKGATGPKGDPGPQGYNGTKGEPGLKGDPGLQGPSGIKGERGLKGDIGLQGPKGDPGLRGTDGSPGVKGSKGEVGPQGPPGNDGQTGPQGFNGTKGDPGQKGEPGPMGPQGPSGGQQLQNDCLCIKPPKIDIFEPQNSTSYYPLDSSITLRCDSNGTNPKPSVTWNVPNNDACVNTNSSSLVISSLQPSDVGNYTCTVTNQYGTVSRTFEIISDGIDSLSCNFENNNMCLWKTNSSSLGTWTVNKGQTLTVNTGPDTDHTLGNQNGHYAYIESSYDRLGATGYLTSLELPARSPVCFSFWYNMYGAQIGSLILETVEKTPSCGESTSTKLNISGDQGNVWHQAQVYLPPSNNPYKIVIESVRGPGGLGDTAIDDVKVVPGDCRPNIKLNGPGDVYLDVMYHEKNLSLKCDVTGNPPPTFSWTKSKSCRGSFQTFTGQTYVIPSERLDSGANGVYTCRAENGRGNPIIEQRFHIQVNTSLNTAPELCTFDSGNLCDWEQSITDTFNWTSLSGPTISDGTGPSNDHTLNSASGKYVYIETSSPRIQGDYADLVSRILPSNQSKCLEMWYTMYGSDTGDLQVIIQDHCTNKTTTVFSESGDKGPDWNSARINIPAAMLSDDYKIIIRASVGPSYHGDTAIDDLKLEDGSCTVTNADCDFNSDTCNWVQSATDDFDWTRNAGSTQSTGTGPLDDNSGGGSYMYTEASSPRQPGQTADLISEVFPAGQDYCFTLYTSMYGGSIGSIQVMVKETSASSTPTSLATFATGDSTQIWTKQQVDIPAQTNDFNIVIRGTIGSGYSSDEAVDDLHLKPGHC